MAIKKKAEKLQDPEADEVRRWMLRIKASEAYRDRMAGRYRWKEIVEEYKGQSNAIQNATDIYIPPLNYQFAYVKTEIPSLTLRDPNIKVNPKNGKSILAAKILTKALNYLWRVNRYKRENKKNVLDVKLVGHSWFKSGYTGRSSVVEDGEKQFEFISSESFFGYRVPYDAICFNQDSLDPPYDCTWIAHAVWLPMADLKAKDSGYKNTNDLQPSDPMQPDPLSQNVRQQSGGDKAKEDPGSDKVKVYEVWDKIQNKVLVVCDQSDHFLRPPRPWPCKFKGFPFSYLEVNDNPDAPYGIPDVFMFDSQVYELTKVRAMELDHVKRFNRQLLVRKNSITGESVANFQEGRTGALIEADIGPNESINNVITPIPYPQLQPDIYQIEQRIKEDMINVSGQSATERGATQQTSTRTFRELAQMDRGAKNRRSEQVDAVEDFVEDIAGNQIALLQQLADAPFFVRVSGEDPQAVMQELQQRPSALKPGAVTDSTGFTFTKEDIIGEFDIDVVPGSTAPLDSDTKMQHLLDILDKLPALGAMPGGPVIAAIGLGIAEELDIPEVVEAIKQEGQLQQKQQAEAQAKADEAQHLQVADSAAKHQLEAEKVATKQTEALTKALAVMKPEDPPAAPKTPEKKGPSESMAFKDLPEDGKVQMARQAGITLTPAQIQAEEKKQQEAKKKEAMAKQQQRPKPTE